MKMASRQEIQEFDRRECQRRIQELDQEYNLDQGILQRLQEIWPDLDRICCYLLDLEQRIHEIDLETAEQGRQPPGPRSSQFRIGTEIYENIEQASQATGFTINTLKSYCSRKPETYSYIRSWNS